MSTWAIILIICFSGTVALTTVVNFFRTATRDSIESLQAHVDQQMRAHEAHTNKQMQPFEHQIKALTERLDRHTERLDRHIENHPT